MGCDGICFYLWLCSDASYFVRMFSYIDQVVGKCSKTLVLIPKEPTLEQYRTVWTLMISRKILE